MFGDKYPRKKTATASLIHFPNDGKWRKELFGGGEHRAKMNLYIIKDFVENYTSEKQTILDPFGGVGSLMFAALYGRDIITVEIERVFYNRTQEYRSYFEEHHKVTGMIMNILGNSMEVLPLPCDHIITSPPYAYSVVKHQLDDTQLRVGSYTDTTYGDTPGSLAALNMFMFKQKIKIAYKLCYDSLRRGGYFCVVMKDIMENNKRVYLSADTTAMCHAIGFEIVDWFKRYAPGGGCPALNRKKGLLSVEDEDIMIMRKR